MNEQPRSVLWLAARVLLSLIFLFSGTMKIINWQKTTEQMSAEGMVAVPLFLAGAIALELAGGLSVALGLRARLGALALVVFLIPATLIFHDFWTFEGPAMQAQMQNFLKNVTILGGLLGVAAIGSGRCALDSWLGPRPAMPAEARPELVAMGGR